MSVVWLFYWKVKGWIWWVCICWYVRLVVYSYCPCDNDARSWLLSITCVMLCQAAPCASPEWTQGRLNYGNIGIIGGNTSKYKQHDILHSLVACLSSITRINTNHHLIIAVLARKIENFSTYQVSYRVFQVSTIWETFLYSNKILIMIVGMRNVLNFGHSNNK